MAAAVPPIHTIRQAIAACGVDDVEVVLGQTHAQRMATDMFDNDFDSCMDKTVDELTNDFKSYATLTIAQGRITINPGIKRRITALIQWARDQICTGRDPQLIPFSVLDAVALVTRMKSHDRYLKDASKMLDAAKPKPFTNDVKWDDWEQTFQNYLRFIPGANGIPLTYIIRENPVPDETPRPDFMDEYVHMAPLVGVSYSEDNLKVLTLLNNFIVGNDRAEGAIKAINTLTDGRVAFFALKHHYEGEGILQIKVTAAEKTIKDLFYAGEKPPHMW